MRDQKLWTRNMKGFRFLGVGGIRSAWRENLPRRVWNRQTKFTHNHWLASLHWWKESVQALNQPALPLQQCAILIQTRIGPIVCQCQKSTTVFHEWIGAPFKDLPMRLNLRLLKRLMMKVRQWWQEGISLCPWLQKHEQSATSDKQQHHLSNKLTCHSMLRSTPLDPMDYESWSSWPFDLWQIPTGYKTRRCVINRNYNECMKGGYLSLCMAEGSKTVLLPISSVPI